MKIDNVSFFTIEQSEGGYNISYSYSTTDTETKKKTSTGQYGNIMVLSSIDKEVKKNIESIIEYIETTQLNKYEE